MGGAKASDTTVTEQQSKAMAQPLPAKTGKTPDIKLPAIKSPGGDGEVPLRPETGRRRRARRLAAPGARGRPHLLIFA